MFSDPGGKRSVTGRDAVVLLIGLILGLLLGGLLPSGDALAQPGGSYSKTCKNCTDDGSTLRCECSYKNKFSPTSIVYGMCESNSIWNDKSKLKCTPRGSFKRSCSNISWNENRLQAVCNSKKGKKVGTTYDNYPGCSDDIANCDGNLTCGRCP
jgi:hypothetical protein